jgi:hypothetical protein
VEAILMPVSAVALIIAVVAVVALRSAVRHTSLGGAWCWAAVAVAAWCSVWWLTFVTGRWSGMAAQLAWYGVAVLMLCPAVAVLGARRPGARSWTWFVVLPLLAVLSLPAVTVLLLEGGGATAQAAFRLEAPWALGFGLVLVMGAGNYVGTRVTTAALAYAAAELLLVAPLIEGGADLLAPASGPWLASLAIGVAGGVALLTGGVRRTAPGQPLDRLWRDFRNLYGVVWSRRLMDRTNEALAARRLPARLEWSGVVWIGPSSEPVDQTALSAAREHAAQTLGWLLKRFADPEWIERRLTDDRVTR